MGGVLEFLVTLVAWAAIVVTAVAVVGLRNIRRDADRADRGARALASLLEIDAELHSLEVFRTLEAARTGNLDPAEAAWLTALVRRAHERRGEGEAAFRVAVADSKHALDDQTNRRAAAVAASQRISSQVRIIGSRVPAVQQRWVDELAPHA